MQSAGDPVSKIELAIAAGTSVAMIAAGSAGDRALMAAAAGMFAVAMIAAAVGARYGLATGEASLRAEQQVAARTTVLNALSFGWGAATLLGIYLLTPVRWQHGWQYGLAMAIISGGLAVYARALWLGTARIAQSSALRVSAFLGLGLAAAAATALAWLVWSGKLASVKGDWAANDVFLAGGVAVIAASLVGAMNGRTFARRRRARA